jgi:hypothetical protein
VDSATIERREYPILPKSGVLRNSLRGTLEATHTQLNNRSLISTRERIVHITHTKTDPPVRLLVAFQQVYSSLPEWVVQAPERQMWVAACVRDDKRVRMFAADSGGRVTFTRQSARRKVTHLRRPLPRWARFPAGVIVALGDRDLMLPGMTLAFVGDEAPGPRFDHSLGMAIAALGYELCGQSYTPLLLLELVEQVRREYIEG